jgi:phage shock protein A
MALITRLTRLFRADVHAVLDRIEEPDVLLRQAVRDMEEECGRDAQRIALLGREREQLVARLAELDHALAECDEQLDVCFRSGEEDLARPVVRRQLEAQRLRRLAAGRLKGMDEDRAALRHRLDDNHRRLEAMRQKAELLAEEAPQATQDGWLAPELAVRDEEVEVALLREKQRRARP